jgi:hypothetical protein
VPDEAIAWASPPQDTDEVDGTQNYNMGRVFTLTEDLPVVGVQWRVPDTLETPAGGTHGIALWDATTNTRLAFKAVNPTPGGIENFLFDEVDFHDGLTSETLLASIYTNHYVYRAGAAIGSTSPSGAVVAGESRLLDTNAGAASAAFPAAPTTLNFYVSPIVRLPEGDHTTTGTAPVAVAATGASTTARTTSGTAAAAVTASATTTTARTTFGTAPVAVTATATSGTARASVGVARATVTATGSGSTARTTTGTARVAVTAGSYTPSAAGTAGPRLVSRYRETRIVTRTQVAN